MANNQTMTMIRAIATLKGIAVLSTARRPAGMVEGPVGMWVAMPSSLTANTGVTGTNQTYVQPHVVASFNGTVGALWTEVARWQASDLVFARSARGKTSTYAGVIHGISADIWPAAGSGEDNWPAKIAQLWNGLSVVIVTDSGKTVYTVPLREVAVIAPNSWGSISITADGNDTPVLESSEIIGATGACPRSGAPVMPIVPALPWTGQTGDDVMLVYSGPSLTLTGNPRVFLRLWTLAAQIDSTDMQQGDGGVSNLDPENCRSILTDREALRMIGRWAAAQSGREDDGEA